MHKKYYLLALVVFQFVFLGISADISKVPFKNARPLSHQIQFLGDSIYHPGPDELGPDEDDREVWEDLDAIDEDN